jgi:chemotaxis response regulator CheB
VLTVEDDPTVRADLRLVLEDAGFDVVAQAGDEAEAVELVREHRPDVVVLRSRGEASQRILEERPVPIVELPGPFSPSQVVEAVTGAVVAHREQEIRDDSLSSIETLVDHLSFATPTPTELEQASWERGHVWRRVSGADDLPEER